MLSVNYGSQAVFFLTLRAAVLRVTTLARLEILNLCINCIIEILTRARRSM